ncbi:acyltransferase family protein [Bradyrhizobium guangdongense]|uniref:acyltransferase family protein n=1 Tax=Bradyrhizobium guangdongense TaxID=1325090 RepID=UPI0024C0E69E|nr:acyltransferase [Bradyrhizobium guangdongense]
MVNLPIPAAHTATIQFAERTFVALDGLRGVAAIMVALRHAPFLWEGAPGPTGWMRNGYLAVDLFFVLSGFVLEHAYRKRFLQGMPVRSFMLARVQRLYPLYALAFILSLPFLLGQLADGVPDSVQRTLGLLCSALMLPTPNAAYPDADLYPFNFAAWSLLFELAANLLFAVFGARLGTKSLIRLVSGFAVALVVCAAMGWLGFGIEVGKRGVLGGGPTWETFGAGVIRVGFSFFAGVLLYRFHETARLQPARSGFALGAFALVIAILAVGFPRDLDLALSLVSVLVVFPLAIMICARFDPPKGALASIMQTLGLLSYGIYVLQVVTFHAVEVCALQLGIQSALVGLVAIPIVAAVAYAATVFVDVPVRLTMKQALKGLA